MVAGKPKTLGLLTGQERRVVKLVVEGLTNKEIAATLHLSPFTARRHVENILRKLGLKNRVQAAVFAVRMENCSLEKGEALGLKKAACTPTEFSPPPIGVPWNLESLAEQ
jgi:DNA-binding CsgD family transcriptional regulator